MIIVKHMNMNRFMLVRVEVENKTKILKNFGHHQILIWCKLTTFFSNDKKRCHLFNGQMIFL